MPDGSNIRIAAPPIDPVVALWPALRDALAAYNEDSDNAEIESRWHDLDRRFVTATPTSNEGVALLLKYLAYTESHYHAETSKSDQAVIVRTLVRLFSGNSTWMCPPCTGFTEDADATLGAGG